MISDHLNPDSKEKADIFTIGHSNLSAEEFLSNLRKSGIAAVADVRSTPYSRHSPHFSSGPLKKILRDAGVSYVFLGKELGGRASDPKLVKDGVVDYGEIAKTSEFRSGINRVLDGLKKYRIALLCAEKEPLDCHRTLLVCRALRRHNISVQHILADGFVEPHSSTERRLLDLVDVSEVDLFSSAEERLDAAYTKRSKQVAFRPSSEQASEDAATP